jgi:hypothetical protein
VPVIQAFPTAVVEGVRIDVRGHPPQDLVAQLRRGINVLQGPQDGDDFIAASEIQLHIRYAGNIEPKLCCERLAHPFAPRR